MILSRVVQNLHDGAIGPGLGVVRSVDYAADPGMNQSPRAHRTGLNCNKQSTAGQAVVAESSASFSQSENLGMGGGVVVGDAEVVTAGNDLAIADNNRPDGNFSALKGTLCRA